MSKRGNSEGSIHKRAEDGKWTGAISYKDENNRSRRRVVYGRTQSEVRRKLAEDRQRLDAGEPVKDAGVTVAALLDDWTAKALAASDRKQATKDLYATIARVHLAPMLGHLALDRLRPSDVEALIVAKRDAGLSASTVRTNYTVLRAALDDALRDRLIRRNVAAAISRPAAQRKDAAYLQAEQAQRLLEVIRGDRLEALYRPARNWPAARGSAGAARAGACEATPRPSPPASPAAGTCAGRCSGLTACRSQW